MIPASSLLRSHAIQLEIEPGRYLVAEAGALVEHALASSAADDCIATPNAEAPPGSRWYYRTDRATQRKCWYLSSQGRKVGAAHGVRARDVDTVGNGQSASPAGVAVPVASNSSVTCPMPSLSNSALSPPQKMSTSGRPFHSSMRP